MLSLKRYLIYQNSMSIHINLGHIDWSGTLVMRMMMPSMNYQMNKLTLILSLMRSLIPDHGL